MKIDNAGKAVASSYASQPKKVRDTASTEAAPQAGSSESVDINPVASQMSAPVFDSAKVAAIKADIEAGRYKVDVTKIAAGLLKEAEELSAHGRG